MLLFKLFSRFFGYSLIRVANHSAPTKIRDFGVESEELGLKEFADCGGLGFISDGGFIIST